jgi:hypothetical protein
MPVSKRSRNRGLDTGRLRVCDEPLAKVFVGYSDNHDMRRIRGAGLVAPCRYPAGPERQSVLAK